MQNQLGNMLDQHFDKKIVPCDDQLKIVIESTMDNKARMKAMEDRVEIDERAARIDSLIIENAEFAPGKSLKEVVIDDIYYHLQVHLLPSDLRHVSRFGADGDDGLPKALKAIFVDVELKNDLLKMKPQLPNSKLII